MKSLFKSGKPKGATTFFYTEASILYRLDCNIESHYLMSDCRWQIALQVQYLDLRTLVIKDPDPFLPSFPLPLIQYPGGGYPFAVPSLCRILARRVINFS